MSTDGDPDADLLSEQIRYYEARAPIYEQLYFRQGAYAVDDEASTRNWERETGELEGSSERCRPTGSVLELACGNGLWTRFLAPRAKRIVAVDSSPTMLARNRSWIGDERVRYVEADLFAWNQDERFDLIFAGFFLSHIPPDRWASFWGNGAKGGSHAAHARVRRRLLGSGPAEVERSRGGRPRPRAHPRLDGHAFTIVKRFFRPHELEAAFAEVGLTADVGSTGEHFLYGTATA
jgi:SAM-dependent methyltransferase